MAKDNSNQPKILLTDTQKFRTEKNALSLSRSAHQTKHSIQNERVIVERKRK